jgi:hypothetical protein
MKGTSWGVLLLYFLSVLFSTREFAPVFVQGSSVWALASVSFTLSVFLLLVEISLYGVAARRGWIESLEAVAPSFLPAILLLLGWKWLPLQGLPPHDFPLRKAEIATGVVWVAHLFWVASILVRGSVQKGKRSPAWAFGLAGLVLFGGITLHTLRCDMSGDEPHYLLMTHSLWRDGDLDLSNNYASGDANAFYGRGALEPQGNEHRLQDGRIYSHHSLGAPLLFYLGYVLAGRLGAAMTVSACAALCLAWTLAALSLMRFERQTVIWVGWVGLFASPLLLYSGLLLAEIPSALVLAGILWAAARKRWVWIGLGLGLLPWMHNRNILLIPPILVALAMAGKIGKVSPKTVRGFALAFFAPLLLLAIYFMGVYGVWSPLGAHHESFESLFLIERFPINVCGLFLDQEAGLWFYFPVFIFLPAGMILGWKRRGFLFKAAVSTTIFYFFTMCFYQNLGLTPPARYWVSLTPLLLLLIAPAVQRLGRKRMAWKRTAGIFYATGVLLAYGFAVVPWMRYSKLQGEAWVLCIARKFTGLPWPLWEPSFHSQPVEMRSYLLSMLGFAVVAGLTALFLKIGRQKL